MFLGFLSLIAACLCWSLVFIIPLLLPDFSPLEIALGRFFCYGLLSLILLLAKNPSFFSKKHLHLWKKGTIFGFASTLLCFTSMVVSIRLASSSVTALIYSLSPISIALWGNKKNKVFETKALIFPLSIMLFGIVFANLGAFKHSNQNLFIYLVGLSFGFIGLFSWTWFAVENSQFLQSEKNITMTDFSLLMGSSMFILTCIIALFASPLISFAWTKQFFIGRVFFGGVGTPLSLFFFVSQPYLHLVD